jgi:predicted nucleotidyltransferase
MLASKSWRPGERLVEESLERALRIAVQFLEKRGYSYAIIGGIALAQWGLPRLTQDVDIKVMVPNTEYSTVRLDIEQTFPESARALTNTFIVAVSIEGVTVVLLLALPGYEEMMINRSIQVDFDGSPIWVCTAEDLIIQKVVANREKDWLDVETVLIEQKGKLDQVYIREWLAQFAEALEEPNFTSLPTQYSQPL